MHQAIHIKSRAVLTLFVSVGMFFCASASAQEELGNTALTARHELVLGVFQQSADIVVAAALKGRPMRDISLDDLGVDDQYLSGLFGYRWRFKPRWTLFAHAFINRVSGETVVSRSFEYDDQVFEVGAALDSRFAADIYMLDVLYSVVKSDRFELQLGGGIHAFDVEVEFDANLAVNEEERNIRKSANDLLAPLPNLGMRMIYALSDRWTLRFNTGWLSVNIDDYDGKYLFANATGEYRFSDHFSLGIGYQSTDMEVEHTSDNSLETFDISFDGPTAFLNYRF